MYTFLDLSDFHVKFSAQESMPCPYDFCSTFECVHKSISDCLFVTYKYTSFIVYYNLCVSICKL